MTAIDESMKMLGRTPEEQCVNNARLMYRHLFVVYTTLKEAYGIARAEELYLQIQKDYPEYARNNNIEKYLARVQVKIRES